MPPNFLGCTGGSGKRRRVPARRETAETVLAAQHSPNLTSASRDSFQHCSGQGASFPAGHGAVLQRDDAQAAACQLAALIAKAEHHNLPPHAEEQLWGTHRAAVKVQYCRRPSASLALTSGVDLLITQLVAGMQVKTQHCNLQCAYHLARDKALARPPPQRSNSICSSTAQPGRVRGR